MTNAERAVRTNTSTYGDLRRLPEGEKHDSEPWFKATGMRHGKRRTISWREGGALSGDPVLVHFVQALAHEKEGEPLETVAAEFPTTTINNHLMDANSALWIVRHTLDEIEKVEGEIPENSMATEADAASTYSEYGFTLRISGNVEAKLNELFEAGCDDASFGSVDGVWHAAFDREAASLEEAIASAITDVSSVQGVEVERVVPDDLAADNWRGSILD